MELRTMTTVKRYLQTEDVENMTNERTVKRPFADDENAHKKTLDGPLEAQSPFLGTTELHLKPPNICIQPIQSSVKHF